ncbi:hypothetical protein Lal_00027934 [Lupinus albus]|nr:hypothetical protein Lal_00027934 [Lupinus albus]
MIDIVGNLEGEKAKKKRSTKMKTGRRRSSKGGGGRGGNTTGSTRIDKVRRTKTMIDMYLNMHASTTLFLHQPYYDTSP